MAVKQATEHVEQVRVRHNEIQDVASSLRLIRENNHFAEQLMIIMEGR